MKTGYITKSDRGDEFYGKQGGNGETALSLRGELLPGGDRRVSARSAGIDFDTAMRIASGFGGGMGRLREVCGAVSGMFMAAGLLRGSSDLRDKAAKDAHYALIQELAEAFRRENGSIVCRELLGSAPRRRTGPSPKRARRSITASVRARSWWHSQPGCWRRN